MRTLDELERDYGMFSDKGNQMVARMVDNLPHGDTDQTITYVRAGMESIKAFGYPEVYDTDVRERIAAAVTQKTGCYVSTFSI